MEFEKYQRFASRYVVSSKGTALHCGAGCACTSGVSTAHLSHWALRLLLQHRSPACMQDKRLHSLHQCYCYRILRHLSGLYIQKE